MKKLTGVMQLCRRCIKEKDSSQFGLHTHNCRSCRKARWEEKIHALGLDPHEERIVRRTNYKRGGPKSTWYHEGIRMGLSHDQYWDAFVAQDGKCKICRRREIVCHPGKSTPKDLASDHCHKTGKFRGLLCQSCNQAIGKLEDDVEILIRAVEYIANEGVLNESCSYRPEEQDSIRDRRRRLFEVSPSYRRWLHRDDLSGRPARVSEISPSVS